MDTLYKSKNENVNNNSSYFMILKTINNINKKDDYVSCFNMYPYDDFYQNDLFENVQYLNNKKITGIRVKNKGTFLVNTNITIKSLYNARFIFRILIERGCILNATHCSYKTDVMAGNICTLTLSSPFDLNINDIVIIELNVHSDELTTITVYSNSIFSVTGLYLYGTNNEVNEINKNMKSGRINKCLKCNKCDKHNKCNKYSNDNYENSTDQYKYSNKYIKDKFSKTNSNGNELVKNNDKCKNVIIDIIDDKNIEKHNEVLIDENINQNIIIDENINDGGCINENHYTEEY